MTRIIAGSRGGRRLATPSHARTRPTTDRVREAVFSAIADFFDRGGLAAEDSLTGLSFCDLYAGSGAVGLEAASRGAAPVLLVERDRATAAVARSNAAALGLAAAVRVAPVERIVAAVPPEPFRIVWLDPPYDMPSERVGDVLATLCEARWLAPDPLVVVERSGRSDPVPWPRPLPIRWKRRYGETAVYYAAEEE
ncbi:16S rRNA (guanine(966)-N(2))-methyltransferase RsmD [Propionicicella superfundia]|uniref:16S rRNA (guanine(966)-N(2))-methyltransferase RsmD n=1 Tax=Propionicicella superfundia TaxID=348582 RepID=UPI00040D30E3|nr:16S rRNA (guanine(966)-N(2))-methyltransferase RsmD [Propionicicella superfundia]